MTPRAHWRPAHRAPSSSQGLRGALFLALVLAWTTPTSAGTIGFKIDTSVTTGPGVRADLKLTHTGDESAQVVVPTAILLSKTAVGERLERFAPGTSKDWHLEVQKEDLPPGVYTLIVRVAYTDENAYPFEVTAATSFNVGATPRARARGTLTIPPLAAEEPAKAKLTLQVPPDRGSRFEVMLVAPSGVHIEPERFAVTLDAKRQAQQPLTIRNNTLLPGTRMSLFALVTSQDESFPQTDLVTGSLRVREKEAPLTTGALTEITLALALVLLVLELLAVRDAEETAP